MLHDLSLEVPAGPVIGLLGPSGGGKTTLMRSIVGVQQVAPAARSPCSASRPARPALRRRVGYVTQAPSVYADLTVRENARYFARRPRRAGARPPTSRESRGVGLGRPRDGQRRRPSPAASARGSRSPPRCVGTPELLVLDEPTVGLDPVLRRDLWELFHRLADGGVTLLVSSHVMDEAARCDRLLLLRDGRLLADDTPDAAARATPAPTDVEEAFLALVDARRRGDGTASATAKERCGMNPRLTARHGRPRAAPAAARPPHHRAAARRAQRAARAARLDLRRHRPVFDRDRARRCSAIFPFVVMFLVTSIATLRERTHRHARAAAHHCRWARATCCAATRSRSGCSPSLQAVVATGFAIEVLRPRRRRQPLAAARSSPSSTRVLGTALGLFLSSAFARTEFQAVQFMPAFVLPQFLALRAAGAARPAAAALHAISAVLPLSYAVDAMRTITTDAAGTARRARATSRSCWPSRSPRSPAEPPRCAAAPPDGAAVLDQRGRGGVRRLDRVSNLQADPDEVVAGAAAAARGRVEGLTLLTPREVPLGGPRAMLVRRTLPHRDIRTIGALVLRRPFRPHRRRRGDGRPAAPAHRPPDRDAGCCSGDVEHRDSIGSRQLVHPGELNVMTAGHGIAHSEDTVPTPPATAPTCTASSSGRALPGGRPRTRSRTSSTTPTCPCVTARGCAPPVFVGALDGADSAAATYSPLLGVEVVLADGARAALAARARLRARRARRRGRAGRGRRPGADVGAAPPRRRARRELAVEGPGRVPAARRHAVRRGPADVVELRRARPRRDRRAPATTGRPAAGSASSTTPAAALAAPAAAHDPPARAPGRRHR